ncbi:MAG: zinc-dependent metalloprotease, partial [Deltaproteobacteria bacterium]
GYEKDVVTARVQRKDEKLVIGDPRIHLVYWENDLFRGISGAHASFQVDPITGEMYHGDVYFGGERLVRNLKKAYEFFYSDEQKNSELFAMLKSSHHSFAQREEERQKTLEAVKNLLSPSSSLPVTLSFAKMPFQKICSYDVQPVSLDRAAHMTADEFVRTWLHEVVIHEVGHNWGLRHNFKGSLGASVDQKRPANSVMDYNDDQLIVEGLFLKTPGVYDDEAIRYGYQKNLESPKIYPFCTDEDADDIFDYDFDPRCARYDSGENPLEDSLIPDLEKTYVRFLLTQDLDDKMRLWRRFFSGFFDSSLYLTRKGTLQDKEFLNASIAKLLDLKEAALPGENTPRDLSKDWTYRLVRPGIADWILFVASVFSESDDSLHDSFLTSVRRLIAAEKAYVSDIDPQAREFLLDDLYWLKGHPSQHIQLRVLDTLLKLESQLEEEQKQLEARQSEGALSHGDAVRLLDINRFVELVKNRIKSFFGRNIGDRR